MSEGKHTPGPWRIEDGTTLVWGNCNPFDETSYGTGYSIIECHITPAGRWAKGPNADEGIANARLIAAAPDLLEALKAARETILELKNARWSECEGTDAEWVGDIDAAIAKAEGK